MREAPRELGEGFAVYSAELKRAAIRRHVFGHYRPSTASHGRPLAGSQITIFPSLECGRFAVLATAHLGRSPAVYLLIKRSSFVLQKRSGGPQRLSRRNSSRLQRGEHRGKLTERYDNECANEQFRGLYSVDPKVCPQP
jgi:hypothetical protein